MTWAAYACCTGIATLLLAPSPMLARSLDQIRERGELVMLSFPHQASAFVRVNLDLGPMPKIAGPEHFEGIDVELMSAFADELGLPLKIRPVSKPSYKRLVPDLLAGKGDLVASSFSITEDRKKHVDYSVPYYSAQVIVIARRGTLVSSLDDLAGQRVVTLTGSSSHGRLVDLGVRLEKLLQKDFMVEVFDALLAGEAAFSLQESPAAQMLSVLPAGLEVVYRLSEVELYGIAVHRGSDLRHRLNDFLRQMKESGKLDDIIRRHLDAVPPRASGG